MEGFGCHCGEFRKRWHLRRRSMQRVDDLNRRLRNGSGAGGELRFFSASSQRSLDDIGGEPLAGSGFEDEEPESEFAPSGEES
jgi:hypothetical protein